MKLVIDCSDTLAANTSIASWVADTGSASLRRIEIQRFEAGCYSTPGSVGIRLQAGRITAEGTNTDVVPRPTDLADTAVTTSDAGEAHSVEPTYTVNIELFNRGFHSLGGLVWFAPKGSGLMIPATAAAGIGWRVPTGGLNGGTPDLAMTIYGDEF